MRVYHVQLSDGFYDCIVATSIRSARAQALRAYGFLSSPQVRRATMADRDVLIGAPDGIYEPATEASP